MNKAGDIKNINNINNTDSFGGADAPDNIDNINNTDSIESINKSNETNGFKNTFPINKLNKFSRLKKNNADATAADTANTVSAVKIKRTDRMKVLNMGQILLALFLFIIICVQTFNLFAGNAKHIAGMNMNQTDNTVNTVPQNAGGNQNSQNNNASENLNINNTADTGGINNINSASQDNSGVAFILGESGGKLAVFSPDKSTVYQTFDVYIDTLPEYDRNLLISGIKVTSTEELHSLLEDYSS